MARIFLVTPAAAGSRNGNLHTAGRWSRMLRDAGHRVSVGLEWTGQRADMLLALHARRSHASVARWREARGPAPMAVTLTGTDLYRDLPDCPLSQASLRLADRVIVLQDAAPRRLDRSVRAKTRVVYQSSGARLPRGAPRGVLRVLVLGHLREEKDPLRAVQALSLLPGRDDIELVQVGAALAPSWDRQARDWMRREPRYRWLGTLPHGRALKWLASSHLLVVSSTMEGGANVISEAARLRTPVIASRMDGNLGMLGRGYPGYFPVGDAAALARLLHRAADERGFLGRLGKALAARRARMSPAAERRALLAVVTETLAIPGASTD